MRIKAVARQRPSTTILVVIGYFHKGDIEGVLAGTPGIEIVQPSTFGRPASGEIEAEMQAEDYFAILSFNLLGVQAKEGLVHWAWMERCLRRLERGGVTAETLLLGTRLAVLRSAVDAAEAIRRYERVRTLPEAASQFTFDGVVDRRRVRADSRAADAGLGARPERCPGRGRRGGDRCGGSDQVPRRG